ncbi:MAG: hypothetical protein ABMA00_01740 [Gemmatimonas sp.]
MPAARVLMMVERRVSAADRAEFLGTLAARRHAAQDVHAHFWVFEHLDEPGRFVEFTEAADATVVATVHDGALPAPLWRAVTEA